MTEEDWLAATDPEPWPSFLETRASDRKLRLYGCACCRRIWQMFTEHEPIRHAIEIAERLAEGDVPKTAVKKAEAKVNGVLKIMRAEQKANKGGDAESLY